MGNPFSTRRLLQDSSRLAALLACERARAIAGQFPLTRTRAAGIFASRFQLKGNAMLPLK